MDRLSTLLSQFGVRASVFYNGNLCGMASYDGADQRGHIHLLQAGSVTLQGLDRKDLLLTHAIISGLIGALILMANFKAWRHLTLNDWLVTAGLGFIGYVGYFIAVIIAATYAGPVVAPAFLGLVPVVLAISGNVRGTISWRSLQVPFALAVLGLLLVNSQSIARFEG